MCLHETEKAVWYKEPEYVAVLLIALLYVALIGRYRAFDLDSVWWLSFSHAFWVQHIEITPFMPERFPSGMGGVVAFGKLPGIVQGGVLNLAGWTYSHAILISFTFVVSALLLFANTCRRLGYATGFTCCFITLLGLTESFVSAAERSRGEFLAVFLLSLAMWLAVRQHTVLAMYVGAMAAEVQPAAVVIPLAILVLLLVHRGQDRWSVGFLLKLLVAMAAAVATYFLLHPHIITIVRTAPWGSVSNGAYPGGFVAQYYLHDKRHWPELVIALAAVATCVSSGKRYLLLQWPALCCGAIIVASAIIRWGNEPYFAFISPFLCLFLLQVFYSDRYRNWILAGILLLTLPQYLYRIYYWHKIDAGFSQKDQRQVAGAIDEAGRLSGKSFQQLTVVGEYNLWFAHPANFINLDPRAVDDSILSRADVILCFDRALDPILAVPSEIPCASLDRIPAKTISTMMLHGHQLQVRVPTH